MDFNKDYYEILEIPSTATREEVKASYRKLAKKHHPDVNPNDESSTEKFKLINEAYQVISNDILRNQYDEYRKNKEGESTQQQRTTAGSGKSANRRTYQRKKTSIKETRFYVRGKVIIDFWADETFLASWLPGNERLYKVHPTNSTVEIDEQNIFKVKEIPTYYLRAYKESELFATPIRQPMKCIVRTSTEEQRYELQLYDIRIKGIQLEGITKHEGQSYGTLKGDIYGYTSKFETIEEVEDVTEWFGETGRFEMQSDDETVRMRREYFNSDGSGFWGPWQETKKRVRTTAAPVARAEGCSGWLIVPLLVLGVIFFPRILIGIGSILAIAFFFILVEFLKSLFRGGGSLVAGLIIAGILLAALWGAGNRRTIRPASARNTNDSVSRVNVTPKKSSKNKRAPVSDNNDSLVSHFIQWEDFDGALHNITLSVRKRDLANSINEHHGEQSVDYNLDFGGIYSKLISSDYEKMDMVFAAFDSLRIRDTLNEAMFAKAIVSGIQSLPYYLVLNRGCDDYYIDQTVQDYMKTCTRDCCVGNEAYGVRTPIEFMGDLKGDCDTRAVFLYTVLSHFGYNVALLTSEHYKHALIAVSMNGASSENGVYITLSGNEYYLWETTSKGFDIGNIPPQLSNLAYWNVALINTK